VEQVDSTPYLSSSRSRILLREMASASLARVLDSWTGPRTPGESRLMKKMVVCLKKTNWFEHQ
jgi:hypothetical protein